MPLGEARGQSKQRHKEEGQVSRCLWQAHCVKGDGRSGRRQVRSSPDGITCYDFRSLRPLPVAEGKLLKA